mgnify:CR=1 FL=1
MALKTSLTAEYREINLFKSLLQGVPGGLVVRMPTFIAMARVRSPGRGLRSHSEIARGPKNRESLHYECQ